MNADYKRPPNRSSITAGIILLGVGFLLLIRKLDLFFFPHWVFSWEVFLIVLGLIIGATRRFENVGWLILVLVGSFFLLRNYTDFGWELRHYFVPVGIIFLGLFIIGRSLITPSGPRRFSHYDNRDGDMNNNITNDASTSYTSETSTTAENATSEPASAGPSSYDDYIDSTTFFGSTKRKIFSKRFRGGRASNFFGSTTIDLTQADVSREPVLEIVQVFGGTKLIIPSNWEVQSHVAVILGGVDDKRIIASSPAEIKKRLVLTGTCIFGGIEIRNF